MVNSALRIDNMKAGAIFALLVAAVSGKPMYNCPVDEIVLNIPDDTDCAIFYKCDHGMPVSFNCPPGLIFNPDAQTCDWPFNVKHPGCLSSDQDSRPSMTSSPSSSTAAHLSSTVTCSSNTNTPASGTTIRRSNTSIRGPSFSTSDTRRTSNLPFTTVSHANTRLSTTAPPNSNMTEHHSSNIIHSSNKNTPAYSTDTISFNASTRSPDTRRTSYYLPHWRFKNRRH